MRFHVLTLFPEMIEGAIRYGIMARALNRGLISVDLHNIRQFTHDRHATVDDYPYSGGPGMVMKPEPLFEAVETIIETDNMDKSAPVILLTPQGRVFKQAIAEELAQHPEMVLICGRYEGFDERVRQHLATDELSIGDYVLGGGEIAAMVVIEATSRLVPGVVGSPESPANDSFTTRLLQHPLYTRPSRFRDMDVPEILLSGNHAEVARWQRRESLKRTLARRPDLLAGLRPDQLSEDDRRFLETLIEVENQQESGT